VELRHIHSFLSLAKNLSFSRTAQLVHLTQPALSLQIQALEKEIGVTLFERNRRKTILTPAGLAFQREVAGGVNQLDQAVQKRPSSREGQIGRCPTRLCLNGWNTHSAKADPGISSNQSPRGVLAA